LLILQCKQSLKTVIMKVMCLKGCLPKNVSSIDAMAPNSKIIQFSSFFRWTNWISASRNSKIIQFSSFFRWTNWISASRNFNCGQDRFQTGCGSFHSHPFLRHHGHSPLPSLRIHQFLARHALLLVNTSEKKRNNLIKMYNKVF